MLNSLLKSYSKFSIIGKVLVWICILIITITLFKQFKKPNIEGFQQDEDLIFKEGDSVYDGFYSTIYDSLVYSNVKNDYEIGEIVNKTEPTNESIILDIGSGTGHHVKILTDMGFNTTGLDKSSAMIKKAKENYPDLNFVRGDVMNSFTFNTGSFTHIMCLYFTIYYMKNKQQFFQNCYNWLIPSGCLCIHLVDRDMFDPLLIPSNPLFLISPQRYSPKRLTTSSVVFEGFNYKGDFQLDSKNDKAAFVEKFIDKNGKKIRRQEHTMFMEKSEDILQIAQNVGFIIEAKVDLLPVQFEYNYIYILRKSD